jgi:CNT family concentrative nucleoside transporter
MASREEWQAPGKPLPAGLLVFRVGGRRASLSAAGAGVSSSSTLPVRWIILTLLSIALLPTIASAAAPATQPSPVPRGTLAERAQSLLGLGTFLVLAFAVGRSRGARGFPLRVVLWGVALQFAFGSIVLFAPGVLAGVQDAIRKLLDFSNEGARLVFGTVLVDGAAPVVGDDGAAVGVAQIGFVFAVTVLPTILFVSTLTAMLYHLGVLTWVVHALAWLMRKTMGTSGAETLSTAANIFVGQTEAPLIVRPFLPIATRSELMAIMVGGFANIATGVLVAYTDFLDEFVPDAGGHLALACFISAPATLVVAKLMMPETEDPATAGGVRVKVERIDANVLDAATRGTSEGVALALNVGAMLIAFTALIALLNALLGWIGGWIGEPNLTLQQVFGYALAPLAWLCGIEWQYCPRVGSLLGIKTVLNEFIAYFEMGQNWAKDPAYLSPRAGLLATYALCGFANFASVGIQIGGISVLAPSRRADLSRIALLAMFGGTIATLMTACVVGVLT